MNALGRLEVVFRIRRLFRHFLVHLPGRLLQILQLLLKIVLTLVEHVSKVFFVLIQFEPISAKVKLTVLRDDQLLKSDHLTVDLFLYLTRGAFP